MKTTLITLILSCAALAQNIPIADSSPTGSPLNFRGSITVGNPPSCSITGHNNASQTIVAWVVELQGVAPNGDTMDSPFIHDHFFKSDKTLAMMAPKPGQDFDTEMRCPVIFRRPGTGQKPALSLKTLFVQFSDGTVWGDAAMTKEIAFQRQDALTYLQGLQSAPDLKAAVSQMPQGVYNPGPHDHVRTAVLLTWSYLSDDGDAQTMAADIQNRLAIAAAHQSWLSALQ